jgi:DNA invertase Pin-like site-specific DNA recombinase
VLVVAEWDRATRSMMDGITIIDRVLARGAQVLDKAHLDLTSTLGKGLLAFLSAIAQDERERIAKRANEGRAAAKAIGRRFGRKPKLDKHQQAEALKRLAAGESRRAIARTYRCSHSTIGRLAGT